MKKTILFAILLPFLLISCDKNPIEDDKEIPVVIRNDYTQDAKHIYVKYVVGDSIPGWLNNPQLNESKIDEILQGIAAVNALETPERDSVFEIFNIHARPIFMLSNYMINIDTSMDIYTKLASGEYPENNAEFTQIMKKYNTDSIVVNSSYGDYANILVYLGQEYNTHAIAQEFHDAGYPYIVSTNSIIGDGNDIYWREESGNKYLTYKLGSGDCPAGCIYEWFWEFQIMSSGEAKFIKSWGRHNMQLFVE